MSKLDLSHLPKNMEIVEHYPESFYKRSLWLEADKKR
jgi:hypothetical protein